jgi:hypothetical protein
MDTPEIMKKKKNANVILNSLNKIYINTINSNLSLSKKSKGKII